MKITPAYSWIFFALGILICTSCSSNNSESPSPALSDEESLNIYYEHFIDEYVRESDGATRKDAEDFIHNTFLKNAKPASYHLKGTLKKITIEEEVGVANFRQVAEFDGNSDKAKSLLNKFHKSSPTFGKQPRGYFLTLNYVGQEEPTYVFVKDGLFQIKNKGMYWSEINLETYISSLIKK